MTVKPEPQAEETTESALVPWRVPLPGAPRPRTRFWLVMPSWTMWQISPSEYLQKLAKAPLGDEARAIHTREGA